MDFYHFYPLWHDLWLDHIYEGIQRFNSKDLSLEKSIAIFPPPSSTRVIPLKIITTFPHLKNYDKKKFVTIVNFFLDVLRIQCKRDIFSLNSNISHADKEISQIISEINFQKPSEKIASKSFGPKTILVIRDFPNMKPVELWPEIKDYKYKKIRIYNVYKDVEFKIFFVGCHTISKGDLVKNLISYSLVVDGKNIRDANEISKLKDYYLNLATEHYLRVKSLKSDFEKLKEKILLQECYQLHEFFNFLGMEWRPTKEMITRIKNKELYKNLYTYGKLLSFEEYCKEFGVNTLKKVYETR